MADDDATAGHAAAPASPLPAPFGRYELLERIGAGGMAEVFLARTFGVAGFEKRLVIKRIRPEHARDPRFVSLFIHEAKIGVHLHHPNLVQVYELGKVGESHYISMEHLHGRDLNQLQRALRAREARLPTALAVDIVANVCRGLAFAHGVETPGRPRLVHRDVSPHNVFLTFAGEVKLVDFGIARLLDPGGAVGDGPPSARVGGKIAYMAPEQARGEPIDHRVDIFAAGLVLWEAVVGRRPHQGLDAEEKLARVQRGDIPSPRALCADVDDALCAILQRALAPDPQDRYASAAALEEDLRAWRYEQHAPDGRAALAEALRDAFPEAALSNPAAPDLRRLADDIGRLDRDGGPPAADTSNPSDAGADDTPSAPPRARPRLPDAPDERKRVVVLVLDVDGFTSVSLTDEPERMFRRHLSLYRWLRDVIDAHGGRIQRAHDDQIYVFFGVPRTRADDTRRALECALELTRRVGALRLDGVAIHLAIGVHSGEVTIDARRARLRYTERGDTTRRARRLSELADHEQILVSPEVYAAVADRFQWARGPWLVSRGGRPPTATHALTGARNAWTTAHGGAWIVRGDELDQLRAAVNRIAEGHGVVQVIHGAPGAGKSRLVREVRRLTERRGIPTWAGHARPFGAPLRLLRELLEDVLGLEGAPGADQRAALTRLRQLGLYARDLEALGALLDDSSPARPDPAELWSATRRALAGLSADGPVVVVLEEVHHLPDAELAQLLDVLHQLRTVPILWLITVEGAPHARLASHPTIRLDRLDPVTERRLVADSLDAAEIGPSLTALIARTCEGSALYVVELLRYLSHEGLVATEDGVAELVGPEPALPGSLAGLIAARIDTIDPAAKGALQLAAVIGQSFTGHLLADSIGLDDAGGILATLRAQGLVIGGEAPDTFAFASTFVREAALRGTLGVQRRDYHRLIAAALERRLGAGAPDWTEALARHCGHGGRPLDAARYAYTAGQKHEEAQSLTRAATCYTDGLAWIASVPDTAEHWDARVQGEAMLLLRLGAVKLTLGEPGAGTRALRLALDVTEEANLPWIEARVHLQLGRHHLTTGAHPAARAHLESARRLAQLDSDATLELEVMEATAALAHADGRNEEARALWGDAIEGAPDARARARALVGLAGSLLRADRLDEAEPLLQDALAVARELSDRLLESRVLNGLGMLAAFRDDHTTAIAHFRASLAVREAVGFARGAAVNHHNIGDVWFLRGDLPRASVAFARSRELAVEAGWKRGVVLNDAHLAFVDALRDGTPEALRAGLQRLEDAHAHATALDDPETRTTAAWLSARLRRRLGDDDGADADLARARALADAHGNVALRRLLDGARAVVEPG